MTSSKACRNCEGSEWYVKDVKSKGSYGPDLLPIDIMSFGSPSFEIHICGKCGLVDWFVPQRFLGKVKEQFERAT
jgi:hypothetical protein